MSPVLEPVSTSDRRRPPGEPEQAPHASRRGNEESRAKIGRCRLLAEIDELIAAGGGEPVDAMAVAMYLEDALGMLLDDRVLGSGELATRQGILAVLENRPGAR